MSGQEAFLAELDATLHEAFVDAGLGDVATYTPPGEGATPIADCHVLVDHGSASFGDDLAPVVGNRTVVRLLTAEVATPERGGTLAVGDRTYTLDKPLDKEPGIFTRWVVTHG